MIAPGNINLQDVIRIRCNRRKVGSPTLNSQPGAHSGTSRKYIPGYADSSIVYLDTVSGNDSNDGSTELLAKLTYTSAATAAGTTKKIRVINNGAALSTNINKPTEMKRGVSGTISSSLTDPINSLTAAATPAWTAGTPKSVAWSPKLKKWCAVSNTEITSSSDGDTWTLEETVTGTVLSMIKWVKETESFYTVGTNGKLYSSTDGSAWILQTLGTESLASIFYSQLQDLFIVGATGCVYTSEDGETWQKTLIDSVVIITGFAEMGTNIYGPTTDGELFTSADGYTWTKTTPFGSYGIESFGYMPNVGLLIAADLDGEIFSSADGLTFTSRRSASGSPVYNFEYIPETGYAVVCEERTLIRSTNGTSWTASGTLAAYPSSNRIFGLSYSPLFGRLMTCGGGGVSDRITAFGPLYANTISAPIAGFTIQAMQYSGTITAYNCTMRQPGTTAALSLDSCRITESGAHISNNAQAHFGNLIEGDFNVHGVPASQNAISLNCNTITGKLSIFNSSSTTYEQIRDNIIEGGFYANYATIMLSGNLRGTNTNGVLSKSVRYDDPVFVDTTDYKLKRKSQGDSQDSPLVAAAAYYVNEQGEQRDLGAWSLDDSALPLEYGHTFFIRKPAGQGLKPKKVPAASADQGIDGVWDGTNEPARASEHLTFTCTSVPMADLVAQDFIESLDDLTCEVTLDPKEAAPTTPIVVNGNHSAGVPVLNIDASTTIKSGMVLTISGVSYYILYTIGGASVTQLVLHKPLESSVSDNASITPNDPVGDGDYIFMPQQRETPRPQAQEKDAVLNLTWAFVRQYPQI